MADKHPGADLSYSEDLDALLVRAAGPRTVDIAKALLAEILDRMREHATNRLLFDLREAVYEFGLEETVEAFREISEGAEGKQIALVFDPGQRETGIVMTTTGSARWNLVRLFHDRESAEAWLRETAE